MTNRIVAHNVDVNTVKKLTELLDTCQSAPINMSLQEVIDGLEEIAARHSTERFVAYLHNANGDMLCVTSQEEYDDKLAEGEWFKNPRAAEEALDDVKRDLARAERKRARAASKEEGKGAEFSAGAVPVVGKG